MTDGDNGWRGKTEAKLEEVERRLGLVESHPMICPQIIVIRDHEDRLRKLENMRWQIAGVVAAVQAIGVGIIVSAMKGLLK